jgi:hypothetical protein
MKPPLAVQAVLFIYLFTCLCLHQKTKIPEKCKKHMLCVCALLTYILSSRITWQVEHIVPEESGELEVVGVVTPICIFVSGQRVHGEVE